MIVSNWQTSEIIISKNGLHRSVFFKKIMRHLTAVHIVLYYIRGGCDVELNYLLY